MFGFSQKRGNHMLADLESAMNGSDITTPKENIKLPTKIEVQHPVANSDPKEIEQRSDFGELPKYKISNDAIEYLNDLIRIYGQGSFPGRIAALKYDIEDDDSLYTVLSKIDGALKNNVIKKEEAKELISRLGVEEQVENIQEEINLGDYVNWVITTDGKFEWEKPRKVTYVDLDQGFAKVEGSTSPFLLKNLKKVPDPVSAKVAIPEIKEEDAKPEPLKDEPAVESLPKAEEEFYIDEGELKDNYNYIIKTFGSRPFSLNGYSLSFGLGWDGLRDQDRTSILKTFDILIQREQLKKEGDKYFAIVDEQTQLVTEENKSPEVIIEPKTPEVFKISDEVVYEGEKKIIEKIDKDWVEFQGGPIVARSEFEEKIKNLIQEAEKDVQSEESNSKIGLGGESTRPPLGVIGGEFEMIDETKTAEPIIDNTFVGPMPEAKSGEEVLDKTFFGPLPETKTTEPVIDNTFVGPMPEPAMDNTFFGPMPESIPSNTVADDTFFGPLKDDLSEKEKLGDTRFNLKMTQEKYALSQINYRKKNKENHKFMTKIRDGLGMQKTTAEILSKVTPKNIESEVEDMRIAQAEYITAKKARMMECIKAPVPPEEIAKHGLESLSKEEKAAAIFKIRAIEQAEAEWDSLQKKVLELTPKEEKGRIMKFLGRYSELPLSVRLLALPILIGTTIAFAPGLGFASGGIAVGAAYTGVRAARGLGGYLGARYAGKGFDYLAEKKNIKTHDKNQNEYAEYLKEEDFEDLEKHDMDNREREARQKQQQRVAKAVVMMGAGAGVGIATGYAEAFASNAVLPGVGHVDVPNTGVVKNNGFWQGLKDKISGDSTNTPKTQNVYPKVDITGKIDEHFKSRLIPGSPKSSIVDTPSAPKVVVPEGPSVKVELSSRGFIQTIDDMKGKLKAQYPDATKMPAGVKSFIEKPSTKLAEDYGFYDPNKGASGMGLKGETLTLDSKGNLTMEHLNGKTDVIDVADHKFHGPKIIHKEIATPEVEHGSVHEITSEAEVGPSEQVSVSAVTEVGSEHNDYFSTHPDQNASETIISSRTHVPPPPRTPDLSEYITKKPVSANSFDLSIENKTFHVDVSTIEGHKEILVDGVKVAEQASAPKGSSGQVLQLLDKYQDGKAYASIRKAFTQVRVENGIFENMKIPKDAIITGTAFENGRIDVLHGVGDNKDAVSVFLNGKEIAKGLITDKGPQIKIYNDLKGGLFRADTVYERAFKQASPLIKAIKK